jgi:hypothetical protein
VFLLASIHVSAAVPNLVPRADSFSMAMRSWPSWKREASGQFRDIDRVLLRNFDYLSFTPLWSSSPVLHGSPINKLFHDICKP